MIDMDGVVVVACGLRRYYRLTRMGSELRAAEAARLKANATAALSRLNVARGTA
jgi:hypothetical protein